MARCYACNVEVSEDRYDAPTDRYYCGPCFEPTVEVQLKADLTEFAEQGGSVAKELLETLFVEDNYDKYFNDLSWEQLQDREFSKYEPKEEDY